jgi:hypothetical protein
VDVAGDRTATVWLPRATRIVARIRARAAAVRHTDVGLVVGAGLVGALPVLWVLGAAPWRLPTQLVADMFRGFVTCALDGGSLTPLEMVCPRAGVPLGMYQLDAGVTYPFGGVFVHMGADPLDAWRLAVTLVIVTGFAALFWLARRLTSSVTAAVWITVLHGLGASLSARSWNWYWNTTAVALLPILFAALHVLFTRAGDRRPRTLIAPTAAGLVTSLVIALEWQYAGLFAVCGCVAAAGVLFVQRGWTLRERLMIVVATATVLATVYTVLRWRLDVAGIHWQFGTSALSVRFASVDLLALVAPDDVKSVTGLLLHAVGADGVLARTLVSGKQLWAAPYVALLSLGLLGLLAVVRRRAISVAARPPAGWLPLLGLVLAGSILLSLGPEIRMSLTRAPTMHTGSPVEWLWTSTPMHWIRYPWTWVHLTTVALLLTFATTAPMVLRNRDGRWSPLVLLLAIVLTLDLVSPEVVAAFDDDLPSVATAAAYSGHYGRFDTDHPAIRDFQARQVPELVAELRTLDGPPVLLPWNNAYTVPLLGPAAGVEIRNTGIDRNVRQVQATAPVSRFELKLPTIDTVRTLAASDWAAAVVLLDLTPRFAPAIVRYKQQQPRPSDARWRRFVRNAGMRLAREGYCVRRGSWFTLVQRCSPADGSGALTTDGARAGGESSAAPADGRPRLPRQLLRALDG